MSVKLAVCCGRVVRSRTLLDYNLDWSVFFKVIFAGLVSTGLFQNLKDLICQCLYNVYFKHLTLCYRAFWDTEVA